MISEAQINYMLGRMYAPETIIRELAAGTAYELAELAGQPVGYLALSHDAGIRRAELHKLYLADEWQGKGYGQAMLRRVLELARKLEAGTISLRVNRRNLRAQRAYRRAGFRIEGELREDIGCGFVMDDFVMVRTLAERG